MCVVRVCTHTHINSDKETPNMPAHTCGKTASICSVQTRTGYLMIDMTTTADVRGLRFGILNLSLTREAAAAAPACPGLI